MLGSGKAEPLVSVVLPTYNRAALLGYALRSVLEQTYEQLEVIVVDDCSSDETRELVEALRDPRLVYLRNDVNLKLPVSLNRGFSCARGQWLTWTSDDNLFDKDAIRRMLEAAQERGYDFVFADYYEFQDLDPVSGAPIDPRRERLPDCLALHEKNQIGACFLYSRRIYETVGDYDKELFLVEDYDYFIRIARSFPMGHLGEPLYYFRRHDDSLYCSRFLEVKASDLLVRYKNGLLDREQVARSAAGLIMRHKSTLRNRWLYSAGSFLAARSYRIGKVYDQLLHRQYARLLRTTLVVALEKYDRQEVSFGQARDMIKDALEQRVDLRYVGRESAAVV